MDLVFGILIVLNCNALNVDETCLFSICARKLITTNGLSLRGCPNVGFPAGRSLVHWWFLCRCLLFLPALKYRLPAYWFICLRLAFPSVWLESLLLCCLML